MARQSSVTLWSMQHSQFFPGHNKNLTVNNLKLCLQNYHNTNHTAAIRSWPPSIFEVHCTLLDDPSDLQDCFSISKLSEVKTLS